MVAREIPDLKVAGSSPASVIASRYFFTVRVPTANFSGLHQNTLMSFFHHFCSWLSSSLLSLMNTQDNEFLEADQDPEHEESNKRRIANQEVSRRQQELYKKLRSQGLEVLGLITSDDFFPVYNRCCENVLGYKKVPLGISNRPIIINSSTFWIPLCTTEGALVASMCRGIKLINASGGVKGVVENLGITRSFTLSTKSFYCAFKLYKWISERENCLKKVGNGTSRFLRIRTITSKYLVGEEVFVKVYAYTGDAMGMNMVTKACNTIAMYICSHFEGSRLVSLSSNICTDKKWSIENFSSGRGRKVCLNVVVTEKMCREILKVSTEDILDVYHSKIVVGSSLVLGGYNCQAANYVAAAFLAFGQDLGHVIESSNCILSMKRLTSQELSISIYMPSLVIGVIGGGTHLEPSRSLLNQFNQGDSEFFITDRNLDTSFASNYLALTVASAVLAGEMSGIGALANNTLLEAHLNLNRKK